MIILVFGVSGVGKTTSCLKFVKQHPEYLYFRASDLLQSATSESVNQLRSAPSDKILNNQNLLGKALRIRLSGQTHRPVLVDSHSVIDNDHDLIRVPVEVVRSMEPNGLILLEAPPEVISCRRAKGESRRPHRTIDELTKEISLVRKVVESYSKTLSLPLEYGLVDEKFSLDENIDTIKSKIKN